VRPSRKDSKEDIRFRRNSGNGRLNLIRVFAVMVVAVGIVVITLLLTNSYEFNTPGAPSSTSDSQSSDGPRPDGSGSGANGDFDSSGQLSSNSSGSSGSGTVAGSNSDSENPDQLANAQQDAISPSNTVLAGCTIHGRVTDDWGLAMANIRVTTTTSEGFTTETVTDSRGRYSLPGSSPDVVSANIALAHMTDSGTSFAVMNGDGVISLSTAIDPATSGYEINFDSWNVQDQMVASPISTDLWPDAASIYQYTRNAESLAMNLGARLDDAPTLQIQAWCEDSNLGCDTATDGAYFIAENELEENSPPIIAMLPGRSSARSPGVPDNREYHEYGHFFLSLQTGDNFELPQGDTNHGGYYENSTTRDSFVEGFAEFYSMMVSRHVDKDNTPQIYTIGADYDLETDRQPWEAAGWWEEFTVAGLLLDLVDDDPDYSSPASNLTGVNILDVKTDLESSGTIVSGSVINTSPLVVRDANVTIRYMNEGGEIVGTQVTRVLPEVIAPTREGTFYAAPPIGLDVTQATATLGGIAKSDDDDVAVDLLRLMNLITEYEREESSIGVSSVAELHDAVTSGEDALTNSSSGLAEIPLGQIDDIFVSHGFFADLDGDKNYNPEIDGEIGTSSHPVTQLGDVSYSEFIPRRDPEGYEGAFVKINTGDVDVDAIIQISMPEDGGSGSYAYVAPRGTDSVELAMPPADQNADVTIITAGKGYKPVIAFRVDADDFHKKVENGTISELQITAVEVEPGTSLTALDKNSTTVQFGVMVGGIVAVILVVLSLTAIRRQWGKA